MVDLPDGFGGKAVGFARWRNEIERRLRGLEKATPSLNRDQRGGLSTVRDTAGNVRLLTGQLDDGAFGIEVLDEHGNLALLVTDAGLAVPGTPGTARRVDEYVAITASTFTDAWSVHFAWASSDSVRIDVPIALDAGTNAEARLVPNWGSGSIVSAVQSALGGASGNPSWSPSWKWQTPGLDLSTAALSYSVQVRRTAGTGAVNVYSPTLMMMSSAEKLEATPTGV